MIVEGASVRSRLLSPREAARLMGLPDDYQLPSNYNDAYGLMGDGVVVPVVRFLAEHILEPVLRRKGIRSRRPNEARKLRLTEAALNGGARLCRHQKPMFSDDDERRPLMTIEALAQFMRNNGGDGCYDAMGTDEGEYSEAIKLLKSMGLRPRRYTDAMTPDSGAIDKRDRLARRGAEPGETTR